MIKNVRLTVAYDGTAYAGWQIQKQQPTIQGILQQALHQLLREEISLIGCSRTDAGVHALNYTANFFTETSIPAEKIAAAVNPLLPRDIAVKNSAEAEPSFHATHSSTGKTYRYYFYYARTASPFWENRAWHVKQPLDFAAMTQAARFFIGEHAFDAFRAVGGYAKNTVRRVTHSEVTQNIAFMAEDAPAFCYEIGGNGFLYNMVRIITGTIVYAGLKKIPPDGIPEILRAKKRAKAGITAPACGLYLVRSFYEKSQCPHCP